ncbi:hypothetical protein [Tumebacillus permanentifrigoris]|uniref:Uncharacterized protein n=1 Tax=Tumebacillus permanentifrigoris TaxID=378543 RepID=A0A316D5C3_9BACL|nr:hypothetical protein [Tumebacillus permanentifrigoris]PWK08482.1 hypothetical protein C7459_115142 [Tumebacillus permanentifrigoris]
MPTSITTTNRQVSVTGQNLTQINISRGGSVNQSATQISVTRQSNNQLIIIGGRGTGSHSGPSSISRHTDIVAIAFRRRSNGQRVIDGFTIIGRANPCRRFLRFNRPLRPAVVCLLDNGFRLVAARNGILVFVRHR